MTSSDNKLRTARVRSSLLALVAICALAAAAAAFAKPARGVAAAIPTCSASNLRLDKVSESDFTSHRGWNFAFRNIGPQTCHLKGFPRPTLLDGSARPEPTRVVHFGGPAHNVVIAPFHRAFFSVTFAVSGPCPAAVFADGIKFVPPHDAARLVYYAGRFDLCGPGPALLSISPVAFPPQF